MTLGYEGSGRECSVVMHRDATGVVTAQWEGRGPGSWVKVSCEAIDALVAELNNALGAAVESDRNPQ